MAGGSDEYVAGCIEGQENARFGVKAGDSKYVDVYKDSIKYSFNYDGAKPGDAIKETKGWNKDHFIVYAESSAPNYSVFFRGR